jgi:predicted dehydrogenase
MASDLTRRQFVMSGAALGASVIAGPASAQAPGANDRIRLGFIGVGNRGGQLLDATLPNKDVEVVALCDVYQPHLDKWAARIPSAAKFTDFRKLIERKDIDAIVIATPDHWHAIQTINACDSGKDVYVEKPLSMTIHEGRKMVEAARRNGRIVQVGLHRRSSPMYTRLVDLVRGNTLGKVTVGRAYRLSNMSPNGIGIAPDGPPPPDLDWDMWLGPRAKRPFNPNIAPYKFRWWKAYSSQVANWGVHYFDAMRWLLGEESPASVCAMGGKFAVNDARDIPDTMETTVEFASGRLLVMGQYEASGVPALKSGELELRGTQGALYVGDPGYEIVPERGGQFQSPEPRMKPVAVETKERPQFQEGLHMRNFLDCVKSRRTPNCDVEEGHRSTVFAHLANISLATRSRIDWDPRTEQITNNRSANSLLHYRYRAPWRLD